MKQQFIITVIGTAGSGVQLLGTKFAAFAAKSGYFIETLVSYPSQIRSKQSDVMAQSIYNIVVSTNQNITPNQQSDLIIVLDPKMYAAIPKQLGGATVILNQQQKWQNSILNARFITLPFDAITQQCFVDSSLAKNLILKNRNIYVLGLLGGLFSLHKKHLVKWLEEFFVSKPQLLKGNLKLLEQGYAAVQSLSLANPLKIPRKITREVVTGNQAFAHAIRNLSSVFGRKALLAFYPITPATSIAHEIISNDTKDITCVQTEDEIAAAGMALGAAYGGGLGLAITSGPGLDLMQEMLGLAVMTELPMIVIDVQRAGPSTGLPTKPAQSDLLTAVYGRHGNAMLPVLAAKSVADCYEILFEAFKLAIKYMTPVIILSDAYLADALSCWKPPKKSVDTRKLNMVKNQKPNVRNKKTLACSWIIPGTKGGEHVISGMEHSLVSGEVCDQPHNHHLMNDLRQQKIELIAQNFSLYELFSSAKASILVITWGSVFGSVKMAVDEMLEEGNKIALMHFRLLYPLPSDLSKELNKYQKVVVFEMNGGDFAALLKQYYKIDVISKNKRTGTTFSVEECVESLREIMNG